ncbi:kinase-like protein [Rhizodiscina lignyota]|uniref:Kinase-like protein n=1 Tax=Rhizodiscina lignyota TaxID=1504668 RepID=A0A9P4MGW2_9PEZI|nr:kinase-like protein [Rhizodiscina lignyota]
MDPMQRLRDKIQDILEPSCDDDGLLPPPGIIPEKSLRDVLSEPAVKEVLESFESKASYKSKEQCEKKSTIGDLMEFICGKATKIFATIVLAECSLELIHWFHKRGIDDSTLPISLKWDKENQTSTAESECTNDPLGTLSLDSLTSGRGQQFMRYQHLFLAPVFQKEKFEYSFSKNTRLPFVDTRDNITASTQFSEVKERRIHRDYLQHDIIFNLAESEGHPRVAVKILKPQMNKEELNDQAGKEVEMLKLMKELEYPHLIRTIAYYRLNETHHFVFPWAENGSLRNVWRGDPPRLEKSYLEWVFNQLYGLAMALDLLHHTKKCRHGDLKPENILCFKDGSNNDILVVADLGLATVHQIVTEMRKHTNPTGGTLVYLAPEAAPNPLNPLQPRPRRYDVWAMGCIYLEFVIWLLYGVEGLARFTGPLEAYYVRDNKTVDVHGDVKRWTDYIKEEDCCPESSAIRRLIDLISAKLLTVNVKDYDMEDPGYVFERNGNNLDPPPNSEPLLGTGADTPHVIVRADTETLTGRFSSAYNPSVQPRWTSRGMRVTLRKIIDDVTSGKCKWMNFDAKPSAGPPAGSGDSTLKVPLGQPHRVR